MGSILLYMIFKNLYTYTPGAGTPFRERLDCKYPGNNIKEVGVAWLQAHSDQHILPNAPELLRL